MHGAKTKSSISLGHLTKFNLYRGGSRRRASVGSLALVADALHNLADVLGLAIAWFAAWLACKAPTLRRTYGYKARRSWRR